MHDQRVSIVWFRNDLRIEDNPALHAAERRGAVLPIFLWAPEEEGRWPPGAASRWWLHQSLLAVQASLRQLGVELVVRRGPTLPALLQLAEETRARAVFWNRRYEPYAIARDGKLAKELRAAGLEVETFNSALLHEPWTVSNKSGKPFQVFTPFWRRCLSAPQPPAPIPAPTRLRGASRIPAALPIEALGLEPKINWTKGLRAAWSPGETGAQAQLRAFLKEAIWSYEERRDCPARAGTSRLSPHLHFGEVGPRQIWHSIRREAEGRGIPEGTWRGGRFLTEIGWREFAHHLLGHYPHTADEPLRAQFRAFPWGEDTELLRAWQRGRTGYPIVDAGMGELWATGWMHNRVRMIVASFLVKDLLISWTEGARWFWDTLVDADLAQNTLGWQWSAGCGADAAPYFRVFNPASQGEKFDPEGDYVRRWRPELAGLPDKWLHRPSEAPAGAIAAAGIRLGRDYPLPVVNHATARLAALGIFARLKK